jgi:hypothetical protein
MKPEPRIAAMLQMRRRSAPRTQLRRTMLRRTTPPDFKAGPKLPDPRPPDIFTQTNRQQAVRVQQWP